MVKSIAYYLSTRIPAYYHNLDIAAVSKILQEAEFDAATLFKYLILTPLQNIGAPEKTMVILIDALDEASQDNLAIYRTITQMVKNHNNKPKRLFGDNTFKRQV